MDEVIYNYNKIMQYAEGLEHMAKELENDFLYSFDKCIQRVNNAWDGAASEKFLMKCNVERWKIQQLIEKVHIAASSIRQIADNEKKAEVMALSIAHIPTLTPLDRHM